MIERNVNFLTGQTNPSEGAKDDAYSDDETEMASTAKELANATADHLQQAAEEAGRKLAEGVDPTMISQLVEDQDVNNNQGSNADSSSSR